MPMPIPKPPSVGDTSADMHCISFADTHVLPFTNVHQPALAVTTLRHANRAKKKYPCLAASKLRASTVVSSLANKNINLKIKNDCKIAISARVRGVVHCKDCLKPRCIYAVSTLSHMKSPLSPTIEGSTVGIELTTSNNRTIARDRLKDAMESAIFLCGMAPLDPDDSFCDVFLCDPVLDCNTHTHTH